MKKIVVLGGGAQGAPCASILARMKLAEEIVLADADERLARRVADKIGTPTVAVACVDAKDTENLAEVFRGAQAVINLINPLFNARVMEACLRAGAHYVDTSIGETLDVDILATDNTLRRFVRHEELKYAAAFRERGLTCLIGCGSTPGVTNVLARRLCDRLDGVDAVDIRFARKPAHGDDPDAPWIPSWAPVRALWGYTVKPYSYENGTFKENGLFAGYEEYAFHEPVGTVAVTHHHHPEQFTIPYFMGERVKSCTFKFYIDEKIRTFVANGLTDPAHKVRVGDVEVTPRDVLLKLVRQTSGRFLEETEATAAEPFALFTGAAVEVTGTREGRPVRAKSTFSPTFCDTPEEKVALLRKFGATNIYVALPAIVGATLCVEGQAEAGVISAECLDPDRFFSVLEAIQPLRLHETVSTIVNA